MEPVLLEGFLLAVSHDIDDDVDVELAWFQLIRVGFGLLHHHLQGLGTA